MYPYIQQQAPAADYALIHDIAKAIDGEFEAVTCYAELAKLAPNREERQRIEEIRNDEVKHYQLFSSMYMSLTGRQHHPATPAPCPKQYREGVRAAFIDEQETVDFYLDISDRAQDMRVKEAFRRAALDEQNHAVWFLSFLK